MNAARALMTGLVDYAGLFPPAGLDMRTAVQHYREYLADDDRWMLGRFVVPAVRLEEFQSAFNDVCCGEREPAWPLSLLSTGDPTGDAAAIASLVRGAVIIDSLEVKAATPTEVEHCLANRSQNFPAYVEFSPAAAEQLLPLLSRFGARAKIRTGGVTAEAFLSIETIADFLMACARARVPFKATAGLHHALRGAHPLTYEANSTQATMHGFANVFLAAVLAWRGAERQSVRDTLAVSDADAIIFSGDDVRWLGFHAGVDEIIATRREFAISYGSCSFIEPIEEAKALKWL